MSSCSNSKLDHTFLPKVFVGHSELCRLACFAPPRACTNPLEILYSYLFISHWDWFVLTFEKSCKGFLQALKRMKMSRFC